MEKLTKMKRDEMKWVDKNIHLDFVSLKTLTSLSFSLNTLLCSRETKLISLLPLFALQGLGFTGVGATCTVPQLQMSPVGFIGVCATIGFGCGRT